jgi:hypothetical protein
MNQTKETTKFTARPGQSRCEGPAGESGPPPEPSRRVRRDLDGYDAWLDQQNSFEREQRDQDRFGGDNRGY